LPRLQNIAVLHFEQTSSFGRLEKFFTS